MSINTRRVLLALYYTAVLTLNVWLIMNYRWYAILSIISYSATIYWVTAYIGWKEYWELVSYPFRAEV